MKASFSSLTIQEVANNLRLTADSIRADIENGELTAFDVAPNSKRTGRKHWRISQAALEDFIAARGNG